MRTHGWVLGWCVHVRRFKSCLLNHVESEHIPLTLVGVVWRRLGLDMTFREISTHLQISTSTAHRIYRKFEETGDVSPVRHNRCPDHRKLDDHHEFLLIAIVMENPCYIYMKCVAKFCIQLVFKFQDPLYVMFCNEMDSPGRKNCGKTEITEL